MVVSHSEPQAVTHCQCTKVLHITTTAGMASRRCHWRRQWQTHLCHDTQKGKGRLPCPVGNTSGGRAQGAVRPHKACACQDCLV